MKKLCFLTAALLTAGIMTAQVQLSELPGRVITPQKVNLTEAPAKQRTANYTFQELQSAQQTPQQTSVSEAVSQRIPSTNVTALGAPQREVFRANLTAKDKFTTPIRKEAPKGAVPENIIGKSYNTFYGSFTNYNNCVGWLTVEKGQGDTVILKGFADGYDVKGVYNKTAGTVTCPASQVVGTHASLGTVTFYALRGGSYYKNEPVVLTFTDNNITFSAGVYCAVTNGGVVMMKDDLTAIESNGRLKLDRTNQAGAVSASFDLPLYISNVSDIHMDIQGLQSWLYGHNYKVPFTISGNKATLLTTDSLDWYNSTSGTQCYFMLGFNGTNITADPTFTVTKTDSLITLKADTRLFCGYNESGTSWRGYYLNNYVINNNVVAGGGGGGGEQPNPCAIAGKRYNTFFQSFTNQGKCVGYFTVEQGAAENKVILKGLADGYDVKGTWDATAKTVTCPANQVIGTHSTAGTITFYSLEGNSYSRTEPVVLTFNGNQVSFNTGIYAAVSQGGVAFMTGITGKEANGLLKLSQTNQAGAVQATHELPITVAKTADNKIEVQGLQSWLYGHNYKVPFTISGNKATLLTTDSIDFYGGTNGNADQCFFMLGFNGQGITPDPTFTVTTTDTLTTLTADTRLFCGYNESGNSWRGFFLKDYAFNYASNNQGGGGGEQPNPCAIAGKRYNTFFQSFTNQGKCVGYFTVEQGAAENKVILKGLADGYDVKGTWDATAKTVTCPANQVIGTHSTAGTITFYSLEGNSYSRTEPVVLTFNGNQVSFNTGIYAAVSQGGVAFMTGITGKEANGLLKLSQTNQAGAVQATHELPITVAKTADNKIEVQGLQSWLYGHNYKVPFTISGNKATLLTTDSIDFYGGTNGNADQCFFMLGFNGQGITPDPTFTVTTTDTLTTLTADTRLFCGYNESGNSWRGFFLKDYAFNYKVEQGGGGEMQDTVTVNNIEYALDHSKKEATVLGCAASLTKLDMPGTINANNTDYTVVAVAEQAFYGNSKLTSASLPKTLKVLGKDAFRNVRNLNELKIEDLAAWCNVWMANGNANPIYNVFNSIQSKWGKVYFNGTQVSTSLEIPASVNRIGRSFYGFKTLTSVTLPTGLKVLGDQSFANCINLPTVEIPSTVDSIGSAFWGCEKINNIVIPNGIVTLGASTFYGCKALTDVKLNEGLKTIGSMTFTSCTALTEIELPTTLTDIAGTAFMSSKNITSVKCKAVVPPTTTDNAFADFAATATLYVLEESIPAYKAALGWKNFSSIKKLDKSVNGIDADNDAPAYYYDLNGFRVEQENLTPGIYVKVQGSKTTKVVIK